MGEGLQRGDRHASRALLLAVLLLAACHSGPAPDAATPIPTLPAPRAAHPQHLFTATVGEPKTFNPIIATDAASRAAVNDVFDTLLRLDPRSGEMQPALAASWKLDERATTLTLTLRDDVHWHDGQPLTAADVAFTFAAINDARVPSPLKSALLIGGKPMTVEAVDPRTVRIKLPQPFAPLLHTLAVPIVPKHVLGAALRDGSFAQQWGTDVAPQALIGSGPYRLDQYEPGRSIHLARNPSYWMRDDAGQALPYLAEQTIRIVPDQATATRAFLAAETDLYTPSGEEVRALLDRQESGGFTVREIGVDPGMLFVAFNRNPAHYKQNGAADPRLTWFSDPSFRRAMAHAVDKATMIATALDGFGAPAVSFISPANERYFDPHLVDYPFDLARARALLGEAGYVDRDGDGVIEDRAGRPIEFTLTTTAGNPVREQIARVLQHDWQDGLQMRVHVEPLDPGPFIDKLQSTFDWDVLLVGFTGSLEPHDSSAFLRSSGPLHVWYPNQSKPASEWEAEIDQLLDRAAASDDLEARRAAYWRIQELLHEHLPIIQTVRPLRFAAASNALENFEPSVWGIYRPERIRFAE
jgi:peptide/nickel transport system substrate-binding protein